MTKTLATALVATLFGSAAFAQGVLVGTEALDDRVDDIRQDIDDDFARANDAARFGTGLPRQGFAGSAALGFSATSGNTDTTDLSAAGRMTYGLGPNGYSIGFGVEYGEGDDVTTREEAFVVGQYDRALNGPLYAFGLGSYRYDDFDTLEHDAFLGAGLGYRVIATQTQTFRIQAGPGVRYTETQAGDDETELAGLVSARYFQAFSDTVSLTNDTDVLYSDDAEFLVRNDFGVNFAITDRASTRVSYRTDYNSDPAEGFDHTDNRLGVSLVYGF